MIMLLKKWPKKKQKQWLTKVYQCQQDTDNKTPEFFYLPLLDSGILHCEDESFVTFGCIPVSNRYKHQKSSNLLLTIICLAESHTAKVLLPFVCIPVSNRYKQWKSSNLLFAIICLAGF